MGAPTFSALPHYFKGGIMKESDRKQFIEILGMMGEIYNQDLSELKIKAYWEVLKDLDIEVISNNATKHLKTEKFFPRPSELRLNVSDSDVALLAYNTLYSAINQFGYYDSVKFDDPVIHSVIELMGGWMKIYEQEQDQWFEKQFISMYKALQHKKEHPEYIKGFFEIDNSLRGYDEFIPSPVLIGKDGKVLELPERKLLPEK